MNASGTQDFFTTSKSASKAADLLRPVASQAWRNRCKVCEDVDIRVPYLRVLIGRILLLGSLRLPCGLDARQAVETRRLPRRPHVLNDVVNGRAALTNRA